MRTIAFGKLEAALHRQLAAAAREAGWRVAPVRCEGPVDLAVVGAEASRAARWAGARRLAIVPRSPAELVLPASADPQKVAVLSPCSAGAGSGTGGDALRTLRELRLLWDEDAWLPVPGVVGISAASRALRAELRRAARIRSGVLLGGETGTGKTLAASAIHLLGADARRPFVHVDCAALSPALLESELFGHERGAFTGAVARKLGRFERAGRGTLVLDEIGELPLALQAKLLRVLDGGAFERVRGRATEVGREAALRSALRHRQEFMRPWPEPPQSVADGILDAGLSPFQRSYAFVLEHGLDAVNADMQVFAHLQENVAAAAGADRLFA